MRDATTLVLDFGGVVTRTLFETHSLTEAALGIAFGTLKWRGPFDPDNDALWTSMQADEISERNYWRQRTKEVSTLIGADWTEMSDFVKAARGAEPEAIIRPEARAAIAAAKAAGKTLAVLSNELDLFYGHELRRRLPLLQDFQTIVDATYTEILKPDPRAYQAILDELKCEAEDCVFVDDQMRNIVGAAECGMKTVHFDVAAPAKSYACALELLGLKKELIQ